MKKILFLILLLLLSSLIYSKAYNNVTPTGRYSYIHDLEQKFRAYIATPSFKEIYAFINIDDETYVSLDNPSFTPPELIFRLIKLADKSSPKLLIIDIDLRPSIEENIELINYLENHQSFPILLADLPSKATNYIAWRDHHILDNIVNENPNLFWVSTIFNPQQDNAIRQSRYFNLYCQENKIVVRPSVALAVRLLKDLSVYEFNELLASFSTRNNSCNQKSNNSSVIEYKLPFNNKRVLIDVIHQNFNIQYASIKDKKITNTNNQVAVNEISAKGLAVPVNLENISIETLNNRIIIIGGTNFESRDIHKTPIGYQYGVYLIINAIESALSLPSPYISNPPVDYLKLIVFATLFAIVPILLRNTFVILTSILLVYTVPKIFDNTYIPVLFSVLLAAFFIEFINAVKNILIKLGSDFSDYGFSFILAFEHRTKAKHKTIESNQNDD